VSDVRGFMRNRRHPSTSPSLEREMTILQALERIRLPENA
jgi:hypothetical protein